MVGQGPSVDPFPAQDKYSLRIPFPAKTMTTPSLLTSLLTLITTATQDLQSELAAEGLPEPWIDHPALHPWEEETPSKKYWEARRTLISALGMMTVRSLPLTCLDKGY